MRPLFSLFLISALCVGAFIHQGWGVSFAFLFLTCLAVLSSYRLFSRRKSGLYFAFNLIEFLAAISGCFSLALFVYFLYFQPSSEYRYDLSNIYVPAFYVTMGALIFIIAIAEALNILDKREKEESDGSPIALCVAFFLSSLAGGLALVRVIDAPLFPVSLCFNSLTLGLAFAKTKKGKLFYALTFHLALLGAVAMMMAWSFIVPMGTNDHYAYSEGIDRGGALFNASLILGICLTTFDFVMAIICLVRARRNKNVSSENR